jgi:cytochrome c biogenesis protein CcdA
MGLHFLGVFRIGLLAREARFAGGGKPATLSGAYVMGLAFAFGWTPCIGPVLGAVLGVAAGAGDRECRRDAAGGLFAGPRRSVLDRGAVF